MSHNDEDDCDDLAVCHEPADNIEHVTIREGFPLVLHAMLEQMEAKGLSHIVSWQPHGKCFIVKKRKSFVELVMPRFFRMSKFASFQRQLNLYGFRRIAKGQDKDGYYHEHFIQYRRDLCERIFRLQFSGKKPKRNPDTLDPEPNFYSAASGWKRPANSISTILNTSTLTSAAATSQASSLTIHPSLFTASSPLLNAFEEQLQPQQRAMNHPSLTMRLSSIPRDPTQPQHLQSMTNLPCFNMGASHSLLQHPPVVMNVPSSLAKLSIHARASAFQDLGATRPQQQPLHHGFMMSPTSMFPPSQCDMQPRQSLPLQLPATTFHYNAQSATFPLCVDADHGPKNFVSLQNPATSTSFLGRVEPANLLNGSTSVTGEYSPATAGTTTTAGESSSVAAPPFAANLQIPQPQRELQSFDAYVAALGQSQ